MKFADLECSSVFRFVSDSNATFRFIKTDDKTFVDYENNQVIKVDEDVFNDMFYQVEVEAWEPDMSQLENQVKEETVEEGFEPYYGDDSEEEIELIESNFFPDYELLVVIGDRQITEFTIHCWNTAEDPDLHRATLWFSGEQKMDSTRGAIEEIFSLSRDTLRQMFGDF